MCGVEISPDFSLFNQVVGADILEVEALNLKVNTNLIDVRSKDLQTRKILWYLFLIYQDDYLLCANVDLAGVF